MSVDVVFDEDVFCLVGVRSVDVVGGLSLFVCWCCLLVFGFSLYATTAIRRQ